MTELATLRRITLAVGVLVLSFVPTARTQTAELSGTVKDSLQAACPNATITVTNEETTIKQTAVSNLRGYYDLAFMKPGSYAITVEAAGFGAVTRRAVSLDIGQDARIDFILKPVGLTQTIVVKSDSISVRSDSIGVNTVIDRQFVENLELNGRTLQPLIALVPGVTMTSGAGQFSINGQRDNANYFTVDGVSANIGLSSFRSLGQTAGGSVPGFNVLGGTNNLVSVDAIQEFVVLTSTYSAEFGRTAGGQVQVLTRSGTNQPHGTLFDYFRNDVLDANNWFANAQGFAKSSLRHNNFGGVIGGPILKSKTFFFLSYEGLRLRLPQFSVVNVPSRAARELAPPDIRQLLDAFPLPNGPESPNSMLAQFSATYSNPGSYDSSSIRVDHVVSNRLNLFARYSNAVSENDSRVESLSHVIFNEINTAALTVGGILAFSAIISNEFRVNYSTSRSSHLNGIDSFGGTIAPADSLLFPESFSSPHSSRFIFSVDTGGLRFVVGRSADHLQRQLNVVDNISILKKSHALKFGADLRYLSPHFGPQDYGLQIRFLTLDQAVTGQPPLASIFAFDPLVLAFRNLSAYAQDKWQLKSGLTIDLGLRWEWNPPPYGKNGQQLYTLSGIDDLASSRVAPAGTPLFQTTYANLAPRIGLAYHISDTLDRHTMLRAGFGIFYDLGEGIIGQATESFPHFRMKFVSGQGFPLGHTASAPPNFPSLDPPYSAQSFVVFDPNHVLPRAYQWNVGLEQTLGIARTISIFYVGGAGRELLRRVAMLGPSPNFVNESTIDLTSNSATSDYNSLQLQFQHRLSRGLQMLVAYTWSHSIDISSDDVSFQVPAGKANPQRDRASSDFDVRHAFQTAFSYRIPAPRLGAIASAVVRGWSVDGILLARTATPVNVTITRQFGPDLISVRPDPVEGEPVYIKNALTAGSRQINAAAFAVSADQRQGVLGRNSLRGFAFAQLDLGVSRKFNLTERISLQCKAEIFNLFNHPNFANPNGFLGTYSPPLMVDQFFGVSTQMLATAPAGGATNSLTSLYRSGGPRSIQLSMKLAF